MLRPPCFAHVAYRFQECFAARKTGLRSVEVRTREELDARIGGAHVLLVHGLWRNDLAKIAPNLRFVQSISAGVDHYLAEMLKASGIRLASAQGANAHAVSEHTMALILALTRRIPEACDNQAKRFWRDMRIGGRLAHLAKAFDLRVVGVRRDLTAGSNNADLDILCENLDRLWRGEATLRNQVV